MAPSKSSPWDVRLNDTDRNDLEQWLVREITNAESSRSVPLPEIEYWWTLFEQGLTRSRQSMPWQDAADLTSYIPSEKVDALRARIMRTVFVEPVYTVEGWGDSAGKAPFVEDFHQWQLESEGLQSFISRVIQASLVETRGVLEVFEDTTIRTVRKKIRARVMLTQDSQPILDEQFQPVFVKDEQGNFIESDDPNVASAEVVIDAPERVRKGPGYRVLPSRNFLVLPAHAKEKSDIWGYAKKFTKRYDLLKADVKRGIYDKDACEKLHDNSDVSSERTLAGNTEPVASQEGATAEKELWELQFLHDLDGKGLRWYVATIHLPSSTLLRLKHEDQSTHRYILFVPFPRSDKSHEGYSFVGHKLITITEEHTAWRNMLADRASLEISAPIKRVQGASWDPDVQPMGPKSVIDVRDHKEVESMQIAPAMNGAINREQEILQASERVAGINDVALGQVPQNSRTLGEVNLVAEQSFVRMDEVIKNLQEPLEDLGQIRQAIWLNVLSDPNADPMMAPKGLFDRAPQTPGLDDRGADVASDGSVTPDMIAGKYRFKPRGSTESADRTKQRGDFIQFMQALGIAFKTWPALMQVIGMNIPAAKSTIEQLLRLFNMPDKQAWIGDASWQNLGQPMIDPMTGLPMPGMPGMGMTQPGMGMPPQMPGAPPAGPPQAPPPQGAPNGQ